MGIENGDEELNTWSPSRNSGDVVLSIPHAAQGEKVFLDTPPPTPLKEDSQGESWLRKWGRARIHWTPSEPSEEPICRTLESCPEGYPRLAAFQSSDHNFMIYRGFSYLHSRLLLYLQDELRCAEKELDQTDEDDFSDPENPRFKICLKSREKDDARTDKPRRALLLRIKDLLMQYDEVLAKTRELTSVQRPSDRDYRSVKRWVDGNRPLVSDEEEFIHCKEDLITLRRGRECAGFDGFMEMLLQKTNCKLIRHIFSSRELRQKSTDKHITYFSQPRVDALVSTIIMLVIIVLLVLPIVGMFRLSSAPTHADTFTAIGVLIVFTLLFCAVMSLLTKARRHEIFAASAA